MEAMKQPTIRVVAVIAEGVPEADTKKLIAYARKHNKILLGPATVGGVQVRDTIKTLLKSSLGSAFTSRPCDISPPNERPVFPIGILIKPCLDSK